MDSVDGTVKIEINARPTRDLPATSIFSTLDHASAFFREGALGYSVTREPGRLDGLILRTEEWHVEPLNVERIHSSYFSDETKFPKGSIRFDHALLMRDVAHEWQSESDLYV